MAAFASYRSLFSFFFLCIYIISPTEAQNGGFSVELIHHDSPKSPFYNPKETPYQRLANAFHRSINRLKRFHPTFVSLNTPQSEVISNFGDYLMKLSIGTPPVDILAVADTGSDIIWAQCEPCPECYEQDAPFFDPQRSSTYKDLPCSSTQCASLTVSSCSDDQNCLYSISYVDQSFSEGNLANDTVTLGSISGEPVALFQTIFGCGHNNDGQFNSKTNGLVGLGGGAVSLISQIRTSVGGKFSYCLVPFSSQDASSSKLNFGNNGVVSGSGVVSTPLTAKDPKTFYFLTLEAISAGNQRITFDGSSFGTTEGNIVIDSGTTLTLLPESYNSKLLLAIASLIQAEPVPDPTQKFDLCYNINSVSEVPAITINFKGADVQLSVLNYLVKTSEEVACFIFVGSNDLAIYGNLMQANFLVGYDVEKQTVSFKQTDDCSKE